MAGIAAGALVDIGWLVMNSHLSANGDYSGIFTLYEIIPGFIAGLIVAVIVTLIDKKPSQEVEELFDRASAGEID